MLCLYYIYDIANKEKLNIFEHENNNPIYVVIYKMDNDNVPLSEYSGHIRTLTFIVIDF